jgi:hypothetical protein
LYHAQAAVPPKDEIHAAILKAGADVGAASWRARSD